MGMFIGSALPVDSNLVFGRGTVWSSSIVEPRRRIDGLPSTTCRSLFLLLIGRSMEIARKALLYEF